MISRDKLIRSILVLGGLALIPTSALLISRFSDNKEIQTVAREEQETMPDQPDAAAKFRRLQLQDENGFIPPDGLEKARQHVRLMKTALLERRAARLGAPRSPQEIEAAGIEPSSWEPLGPGNIGGRIRSIVINPTNTNTMWVGSVSGGIWRTDNGGTSWSPVNDFIANLVVSTMVINPANPNIMFAGTGEANGSGGQGAGVFKSTDGGVTWNRLPITDPSIPAPAGCGGPLGCPWLLVNRLAISANGSTILAATAPLLDQNSVIVQNGGIWRSTDSGTTWTRSLCPVPTNLVASCTTPARDIDFQPGDSTKAIVGELGSARYSTDGGQTWTLSTFSPGISGGVELAYAPSNPLIVYASVNQSQGEIYRSNNGGHDYTQVNMGNNYLAGQGEYGNIIWVNPQDSNFVIVGGIDLWRSTSGGTPLTKISNWQCAPQNPVPRDTPCPNTSVISAHADQHMIVAHPSFNNAANRTVYFGNDGGIFRTLDVATVGQTNGWETLNNNLAITQFYGAAGNATSGIMIGGAQDNGTVRYPAAPGPWGITYGGDGGFCAADPTDPNYFYGEYVTLQIYRSTNAGATASYINSGITDASSANFIAPFILDPNNPNIMLAGSGTTVWRSTDVKAPTPSWTPIKIPLVGNPIGAIAISQVNSDLIVAGHNKGDIFLTFNGSSSSPTWAKIDTPAMPKNRYVTSLVIDSTRSPSWIYATFGGFSGDNIYRTTDLGTVWTDVTGTGATGLPDVPVRSLAIHPRNSNYLYAGTEIGIFGSEDAGASWSPTEDGPANVPVDQLFWMGPDLIAATHGRGLYRASGGTYVDCSYNGIQLGTFDQPFKTVNAAVNATSVYRTIWIKPGNCNETFPALNKNVQIRSLGGAANIGKP